MKQFRRGNEKGFTLIELMIVIAIIGILAAIAIPNFMNYQCNANQREGQAQLSNLRTALESYYAEWNTYTDSMDDMNFEFKGDDLYSVDISSSEYNEFKATATAELRERDSVWVVDQEGDIVLSQDGCVAD